MPSPSKDPLAVVNELCRFQQLAQATDAAASNFALTRRGNADPHRQAASGRKPPSTQPKKAPQPWSHQQSRICSDGDTLGQTVLNPPRPRDPAKGRAAAGLGGTPRQTAFSDTPNHLSTVPDHSRFHLDVSLPHDCLARDRVKQPTTPYHTFHTLPWTRPSCPDPEPTPSPFPRYITPSSLRLVLVWTPY